jgi:hypothetical protein
MLQNTHLQQKLFIDIVTNIQTMVYLKCQAGGAFGLQNAQIIFLIVTKHTFTTTIIYKHIY